MFFERGMEAPAARDNVLASCLYLSPLDFARIYTAQVQVERVSAIYEWTAALMDWYSRRDRVSV